MQEVSADWEAAIGGTFTPTVRVDAWYDGELVKEDVPVHTGRVTLDRTRVIAGSLSLSAASPDGSLIPDSWDSPLSSYGSILNVRAGVQYGTAGSESVSLGWYRIDSADPTEWWTSYQPGGDPAATPIWECRGTLVNVEASDLMSMLDDARFAIPEAPADLASVLDEIVRLAREHVPIDDLTAVADAAIPRTITYQESRVEALQALADLVGQWVRMSPGGGLTLVPQTPSEDPVFTVRCGVNGTITGWGRKQDRAGLRNGFLSKGQAADGTPVQGLALENDGPLRWGGPFGTVIEEYSSNLLTTTAAAIADAQARLERHIQERVAPISVRCVANPALELDDTIAIELPDRTLTGQLAQAVFPLPASEMDMVVMVPRTQLWGV